MNLYKSGPSQERMLKMCIHHRKGHCSPDAERTKVYNEETLFLHLGNKSTQ